MLGDPALRLPDRTEPGVRPGDFAVLVFSGYEGRLVQSALAEYGIPSVIANAGNVFDSEVAGELECVLDAVAAPGDARLAVQAMFTDLLGYHLPDLIRIHRRDEDACAEVPLDGVQEKLERLRRRWENDSFVGMFHDLLMTFHTREYILGKPRGERKLTDLLHLREILHQESASRNLSISGTLSFLRRQRSDRLRNRSDEYEILLETDRQQIGVRAMFHFGAERPGVCVKEKRETGVPALFLSEVLNADPDGGISLLIRRNSKLCARRTNGDFRCGSEYALSGQREESGSGISLNQFRCACAGYVFPIEVFDPENLF